MNPLMIAQLIAKLFITIDSWNIMEKPRVISVQFPMLQSEGANARRDLHRFGCISFYIDLRYVEHEIKMFVFQIEWRSIIQRTKFLRRRE